MIVRGDTVGTYSNTIQYYDTIIILEYSKVGTYGNTIHYKNTIILL